MAARDPAKVSEKPIRRVVPGAAPPSSSAAAAVKPKKKKKGGASASKETEKVSDAQSAALLTKAPDNLSNIANGLKVTDGDLAEEAEKQTALATVQLMEQAEQNGDNSAQKAEETGTTGKPAHADNVAPSEKESSSKAQLVILLQLLHLFNLFHPNPANPPSFAPSQTMPQALQSSTGQQVAALAKLYDQLANGPLEGGGGDAFEILANIEAGSDKEVLPDVTYATVRGMILKLTAPPAEASEERLSPDAGLDGPMKGFITAAASPAAGQPPVSFIQESEIIDHVEQEPEGGQPDTVPASGSGPTAKGESGGAGVVLGSETSTAKADGSAAAQVSEPINTTEENKQSVPPKSEARLNWADVHDDDDDDLGEAPVFEPLSSSATPTTVTPAAATPTSAAPAQGQVWSANKTAAPTVSSGSTINQSRDKKAKGPNTANNNKGPARNGSTGTAVEPKPIAKAQPKVDDDGFIVQESKRTRYLQQKQQQQQQQQQQQNRTGGRGGSRTGTNGNRGGARQGGQQRATTKGPHVGDASAESKTPRS